MSCRNYNPEPPPNRRGCLRRTGSSGLAARDSDSGTGERASGSLPRRQPHSGDQAALTVRRRQRGAMNDDRLGREGGRLVWRHFADDFSVAAALLVTLILRDAVLHDEFEGAIGIWTPIDEPPTSGRVPAECDRRLGYYGPIPWVLLRFTPHRPVGFSRCAGTICLRSCDMHQSGLTGARGLATPRVEANTCGVQPAQTRAVR